MYRKIGLFWFAIIVGVFIVIGLVVYWLGYLNNIMDWEENQTQKVLTGELKDRDIITVVSRRDFVGDYVGQTAGKTKSLLMNNLGKVIFIDEAYSLLNDSRDPYGLEALTTLNLFMSENPESIVVVFAGYKDLMQNGIFTAQPGLPRRCMWHFECDGYDGVQLAEIFFDQLDKEGWKVENKKAVTKLINNNKELFPSFGGDTERLVFFVQLEVSRDCFLVDSSHCQNQTLTLNQVKKGLDRLKDNNIHTEDNSDDTMKNMVEKLQMLERFASNKKKFEFD